MCRTKRNFRLDLKKTVLDANSYGSKMLNAVYFVIRILDFDCNQRLEQKMPLKVVTTSVLVDYVKQM